MQETERNAITPLRKKGHAFYIHGSVHRNSILIRSNKMQQYVGIYLLQNHSLRVSGVHRTHHQENIASATGHSI